MKPYKICIVPSAKQANAPPPSDPLACPECRLTFVCQVFDNNGYVEKFTLIRI